MTTTPHTPGPWEARELPSGHWTVSEAGRDSVIYLTEPNARLIAAAPEMADLLRGWLDLFPECENADPGEMPHEPDTCTHCSTRLLVARLDGQGVTS